MGPKVATVLDRTTYSANALAIGPANSSDVAEFLRGHVSPMPFSPLLMRLHRRL